RERLAIVKDDPAPSAALIDAVAIGSAGTLLTEGNLAEARRYLDIIETTPTIESDKPRIFEYRYSHLFTMLDLCGLSSEAVAIGAPVVAADQSGSYFYDDRLAHRDVQDRLSTYKAYLQNLARAKDANLSSVIEHARCKGTDRSLFAGEPQLWLGDLYESVGEYAKATQCYESTVAERERFQRLPFNHGESPDKLLSEARYHCYLLSRLAQFAKEQNLPSKNIEFLQRALRIYSSNFSEDQLAHIEGVPMFTPSPSMIELALAAAYLKIDDTQSAVKYCKLALKRLQRVAVCDTKANVLSDEELLEGLKSHRWASQVVEVGPLPSISCPTAEERVYMTNLVAADAAITKGDIGDARKSIDTLLTCFRQREILREYPRPTVNMYCGLINLARRLADCGNFEQSNRLLDDLRQTGSNFDHSSVTDLFIDIEKALNAELAKHPNPALWQKVFDSWNCSYNSYEQWRALACLYLAAGEYSRAQVMIDNALDLCQENSKTDIRASFSTALLNLDKGFLSTSMSQFDRAQTSFSMALKTVDTMPATSPSRDLDLFNRKFMCRAVQLAQLNRLGNRPVEAEKILKEVAARLQNKNCWLGVFEISEHPSSDESVAYFDGYYGRLLCDDGKFSDASPYLDKAVLTCGNNVPDCLRLVRAKCAAGQGDYFVASQDLLEFAEHSGGLGTTIISVQPEWRKAYVHLAVDYLQKAKGTDANELAKLYTKAG
ncbi:MAG: tetratricopeptide repeat protein, partial [Terriglobales bacterium]